MDCPLCDAKEAVMTTLDETIMCQDCGSRLNLKLHLCTLCGNMWKAINDEVVVDSIKNIKEMFDNMNLFIEDEMKNLAAEIEKVESRQDHMVGYIHKCIRCGSLAFEESKNEFCCTKCGFSWGVFGFDV